MSLNFWLAYPHKVLLSCLVGPFWRSAHGLSAMNIDESSFVINGDITREKTQGGSRIHVAHSGSVTNQSFLCNGDMDRESFLRLMGSK